ncbi:four helix bundle protein [Burkholderia sp. Bp9125]|nr:four helix bundle protein [Burkholderia sp. Bp9125]
MALHTQLPIYRAAYGLLDVVTDLVKNMPRDFKRNIGDEISKDCVKITILVFRANVAADKSPYLDQLIERLQVIELLLRLSMDKRLISKPGYAKAVEITTSIGKQANGWKNAAYRPHRGGQGRHD